MNNIEIIDFHGQSVEVRRVRLGGVDRPVAFTMYTYVLFKRNTGIDFYKLSPDSELSYEDSLNLYHCAMIVGGLVTKEPFEIPFEPDFLCMVDEAVMFDLAGIKAASDVEPAEEEPKTGDEKNGVSRSRSKSSSKRAVAKSG